MTLKSVTTEAMRQRDAGAKTTRTIRGRRDEVTGRRVSQGRQVAEKLLWRQGGCEPDDSGFASNGRRAVTSPSSSVSTTAMCSSPVDWLDVDRVVSSQVPGAVGIVNHNNTCFISAIIQCLSNTPAFVIRALNPTTTRRPQLTTECPLGRELSRLLRSLWTNGYTVDTSSAFHRVVRHLASNWYRADEQNDALEFAAWLLSRLREEQFGAADTCHPAVNNCKLMVGPRHSS